jgi:putative endonuclease
LEIGKNRGRRVIAGGPVGVKFLKTHLRVGQKKRVVEGELLMLAWLNEVWNRLALRSGAAESSDAGSLGEQAAVDFLKQRHGFTIVTRNWRNPRDRREEIDIVARDGEVLVFVEVRARNARALVPGYYTVNERKKRVLRRAVHVYLNSLRNPPRTFRFDIVEVALHDRLPAQCLHFANVPLFPKNYHVARQTAISALR